MEISYPYLHGWPQKYRSAGMWADRILGARTLFTLNLLFKGILRMTTDSFHTIFSRIFQFTPAKIYIICCSQKLSVLIIKMYINCKAHWIENHRWRTNQHMQIYTELEIFSYENVKAIPWIRIVYIDWYTNLSIYLLTMHIVCTMIFLNITCIN